MKIIKPGRKIEPPTYRLTCPHCEAVLEYTASDIREDWKEAVWGNRKKPKRFVVCPGCRNEIAVSAVGFSEFRDLPRCMLGTLDTTQRFGMEGEDKP